MNVINREDLISINNNMIRVDEVIGQLKHLPSTEVKTFFDSIQKTIPRQVRMGALRKVLKDQVENPSVLSGLTDEVNYRLKWFDSFSEYQLENFLSSLDNPFLEELYREELWLAVLKLHRDLKFGEKAISDLYNLSEIYLNETKEKILEFNRNIDSVFYDYEGEVDGLSFAIFRETLKQSSTLIELREIGVKYDVDVPRRIKKSELIDIILDEMTIAGTLTADIEERVKRMSIMTLQRFAKDNKIKASVELKKEDIIEYIIARVENEVEKTDVDIKVLKADDEPKHKLKSAEPVKSNNDDKNDFRKEIDSLNEKISSLLAMQELILTGKASKTVKAKQEEIENEIEENIEEKKRLLEASEQNEELKELIDETIQDEKPAQEQIDEIYTPNVIEPLDADQDIHNQSEELSIDDLLGSSYNDEIKEEIEIPKEVTIEEIDEKPITEETVAENYDNVSNDVSSIVENLSVEDIENMELPNDIPFVFDGDSSMEGMDLSGMLNDMMAGEGIEAPSTEISHIEEEKVEEIKKDEENGGDDLSSLFDNLMFTEGEVMTSSKQEEKQVEEKIDSAEPLLPDLDFLNQEEPLIEKEQTVSEEIAEPLLDVTFDEMLEKEITEPSIEIEDPILTPIFDNSGIEENLFASSNTPESPLLKKNFDEDAVVEEPFMEEFFSTSVYDELVELEKKKSNKQFDVNLYDSVTEETTVEKHSDDFDAPIFDAPELVNVNVPPATDFQAPEYQEKNNEGAPIFEAPVFETPVFEAPIFEAPNYSEAQTTPKTKSKQQLKAEVKRLEQGSKMERKRRQTEEKALMEALRSTSSIKGRRKKNPIKRLFKTTFIFIVIAAILFVTFIMLGFFGVFYNNAALLPIHNIYLQIKEAIKVFVRDTLGWTFLRDAYHYLRGFLDTLR